MHSFKPVEPFKTQCSQRATNKRAENDFPCKQRTFYRETLFMCYLSFRCSTQSEV